MTKPVPRLALIFTLLSAAAIAVASDPAPDLDTAAVLGAAVKGPRHQVEPKAACNGLAGTFRIRTDWGLIEARGRETAMLRISEVPGIERGQAVSSTDAFAGAMKAAALKPVKAAENLYKDPGGTVTAAGKGVGRLFKSAARTVEKGVNDVSDSSEDSGAAGTADSTAKTVKDVATEVSGMNKARRTWAKKLGVDPYTRNPLLADKLGDLAKASFLGGLATSIAMPSIPGVGAVVTVNDLAYSMSAEDLQLRNEKKLQAMGIEGEPARDYFRNPWFSPTLDVELVDALEALKDTRGRQEIIRHATGVGSEEEARFVRSAVRMLVRMHLGNKPLAEARATDDVVYGRTQAGEVVVMAPLDYLAWNERVQDALADKALAAKSRSLWLTGPASLLAGKELSASGWVLHDRVAWSTADPLASK